MADLSERRSVTDYAGREWVPPFDAVCPACQAKNAVSDLDRNHCSRCGEMMFPRPGEDEARSAQYTEPRPEAKRKTRSNSHAGVAVEKTISAVFWLVAVGIGLGLLLYSWVYLLAGAVLLSPLFLFFYVKSRLRGSRSDVVAVDHGVEPATTALLRDPDYQPERPRDGQPGWYEDPNTPNWLRYWNGRSWTNQERRAAK